MDYERDDDYIDIEAHICRARKLRNEAAAEIIATGWQRAKTLANGLLRQMQDGAPAKLRAQD